MKDNYYTIFLIFSSSYILSLINLKLITPILHTSFQHIQETLIVVVDWRAYNSPVFYQL